MKIVLDTNVLLSAIVFGGVASKIYEFCILYAHLFTSNFILQEVEEKLRGKLKIPDEYLAEALALLKEKNEIIEPNTPKPVICRDIDDNNILQLAESVQANYIITGDKDLLVLEKYMGTEIVSPKQFAEKYMTII
ncbi:MAG: putative toxin-antitoxin system toxin component, PIN family [Thermoflexibacter sp.]|nr:putative toxin-antitoxin system toxin component, PIN family [Thermoflexibacter sp.]